MATTTTTPGLIVSTPGILITTTPSLTSTTPSLNGSTDDCLQRCNFTINIKNYSREHHIGISCAFAPDGSTTLYPIEQIYSYTFYNKTKLVLFVPKYEGVDVYINKLKQNEITIENQYKGDYTIDIEIYNSASTVTSTTPNPTTPNIITSTTTTSTTPMPTTPKIITTPGICNVQNNLPENLFIGKIYDLSKYINLDINSYDIEVSDNVIIKNGELMPIISGNCELVITIKGFKYIYEYNIINNIDFNNELMCESGQKVINTYFDNENVIFDINIVNESFIDKIKNTIKCIFGCKPVDSYFYIDSSEDSINKLEKIINYLKFIKK